jgi:hypothetical protein
MFIKVLLLDATDLKSVGFGHPGSIPGARTMSLSPTQQGFMTFRTPADVEEDLCRHLRRALIITAVQCEG